MTRSKSAANVEGFAREYARLVDDRREELIEGLIEYLRQPSISATGEGFPEATARSLLELEHAGLAAHAVPTASGNPVVVGRRPGAAERPRVLVYGHYDVQPTEPTKDWRQPPFEPVLRDGRIWCRGAADNKGQHYAHLQALRLLLERDGDLPCSVIVVLDGDEERGSPDLPSVVADNRAELACDLVLWSDGPVHSSGSWCLLHGVRGLLAIRLVAAREGTSVHSGNFGNVVPNPTWHLVRALDSMRTPDGKIAIEGFLDGVQPLEREDTEALQRLPLAPEVSATLDPAYEGLSYYERLAAVPSLTINWITAGAPDQTIIPALAEARIDIRLVEAQEPEEVIARVVEHVREHAPAVEVTVEAAIPPSRSPIDNPFTKRIAAALAAVTGSEPLLVPALGGTLPDYVWTSILGVPSIGMPFANPDSANHSPNENLSIDRFLQGTAIAMTALATLARKEPE